MRLLPTLVLAGFAAGLGLYHQLEVVGSRSWAEPSPDHHYTLEGWKYFRLVAMTGDGPHDRIGGPGYLKLVDAGGRVVHVQAVDDQSRGGGVDRVIWQKDGVELCYLYVDLNCVRWPLPSTID
jgi:hypothetical protein